MPRVSVVIPVYGHRDYLMEALDSVFAQTFKDYEVIVINDGSPDDSGELLKPLASLGKIRYFEQANRGQAAARNRGLMEAKGELIALLDDDDVWPADKLEWQVGYLDCSLEVGVIGGTAQNFGVNGLGETRPVTRSIMFEGLFNGCPFVSPGQTLFRKSLALSIGGFDQNLGACDDWDFWFRASRVTRIVMEDRLSLLYRMHSTNSSRRLSYMIDSTFRAIDTNLAFVQAERRKAIRKEAYRTLYRYLGRSAIVQARILLRSARVWKTAKTLLPLRRFLPIFLLDPGLAFEAFKDSIPRSVLRTFAVRSRPTRGHAN